MNKRIFHGVVLFLAVGMAIPPMTVVASAQCTKASKATHKEISSGKELAEKLCAKCHAIAATGDSKEAKAPPFRTFVQKWPIENLEEALAEGIVVGHKRMPEFEFEPEDINNLLSYIDSLSPAVKN